jgi:hypothetical protein
MSGISHLAVGSDISENEKVQTGISKNTCFHRIDGHEDDPVDQPDRKECVGHDSLEANEKVRVKTIG